MEGHLVLVTTGGTIAMREVAAGRGAVPALEAADLCRDLGWKEPLEIVEHCNLPSAHFTLETLWSLRGRVRELAHRPDCRGIVITHGTDTMEETAYLLDLTVEGDCPIVLTGAMRTASDPGYDGPANLLSALRVAASPQARGLGAVVVMGEEIHAARLVTKVHTLSPATFQSPFWGPIGRVEGEEVILHRRLPRQPCLSPESLEERVLLIKLAVGMDDGLLRYAVEWGMRGVVIEALGGGRVPPWWMPTIREAVARGVALVIASRCPAGLVYDRYGYAGAYRDLKEAGVLFADGLTGPKARLKLMAALGAGLEGEALRQALITVER
jgi:L-asparaginase